MAKIVELSDEEKLGLERAAIENPWSNVYWFARMLINGDKYGAVGSDNRTLAQLTSQLRVTLESEIKQEQEKVRVCLEVMKNILETRYKNAQSKTNRVLLLCEDLKKQIQSITDIEVFILTAESIVIPINNALTGIPNNDRDYTEATAKAYLDELGDKGLATVINIWDDLGVKGCLDAERAAVLKEFSRLRRDISIFPEIESNIILTAFMQEFERRLGQKRKSRAGGSLEDVTSFLFKYYGIVATHAPDHFQADIEVDKWIRCSDKWLIGISCKRTLRERWKQVSSADRGTLSRYKIKQIWHLVTYDEDLSDDKITLLGNLGHVFYLRDDSRKLKSVLDHVGMKDYARPISQFISDLKKAQQK